MPAQAAGDFCIGRLRQQTGQISSRLPLDTVWEPGFKQVTTMQREQDMIGGRGLWFGLVGVSALAILRDMSSIRWLRTPKAFSCALNARSIMFMSTTPLRSSYLPKCRHFQIVGAIFLHSAFFVPSTIAAFQSAAHRLTSIDGRGFGELPCQSGKGLPLCDRLAASSRCRVTDGTLRCLDR